MLVNKRIYKLYGKTIILSSLVVLTTTKLYSQAQAQGFPSEGIINLCTPHTNKTVDSPSTSSWANISAPIDPVSQNTELGALPKFTSIKHEQIYTNVDAIVLIKNNSLKSEFIANPGADLHHIMLVYNRARNITIKNNKELILDSEFRRFVLHEPVAMQIIDGENRIIETSYDIDKEGIVSFDIAEYDKDTPLIIIPTLSDINEFAEYNIKYSRNTQKFKENELAELILKT